MTLTVSSIGASERVHPRQETSLSRSPKQNTVTQNPDPSFSSWSVVTAVIGAATLSASFGVAALRWAFGTSPESTGKDLTSKTVDESTAALSLLQISTVKFPSEEVLLRHHSHLALRGGFGSLVSEAGGSAFLQETATDLVKGEEEKRLIRAFVHRWGPDQAYKIFSLFFDIKPEDLHEGVVEKTLEGEKDKEEIVRRLTVLGYADRILSRVQSYGKSDELKAYLGKRDIDVSGVKSDDDLLRALYTFLLKIGIVEILEKRKDRDFFETDEDGLLVTNKRSRKEISPEKLKRIREIQEITQRIDAVINDIDQQVLGLTKNLDETPMPDEDKSEPRVPQTNKDFGVVYEVDKDGKISNLDTAKERPKGKHSGGEQGRHTSPYFLTQVIVAALIDGRTIPEAIDDMRSLLVSLIHLPGALEEAFVDIIDFTQFVGTDDSETLRGLINGFFILMDELPGTAFALDHDAPGHGEGGMFGRLFALASKRGDKEAFDALKDLLNQKDKGNLFDKFQEEDTRAIISGILFHLSKQFGKRRNREGLNIDGLFKSNAHTRYIGSKNDAKSFGIDAGELFHLIMNRRLASDLDEDIKDTIMELGDGLSPEFLTALKDEDTMVMYALLPKAERNKLLDTVNMKDPAAIQEGIKAHFLKLNKIKPEDLETLLTVAKEEFAKIPELLEVYGELSELRHHARVELLQAISEGRFSIPEPKEDLESRQAVMRNLAAIYLALPENVRTEWGNNGGVGTVHHVSGVHHNCLLNALLEELGLQDEVTPDKIREVLDLKPDQQIYTDQVPKIIEAIASILDIDLSSVEVNVHILHTELTDNDTNMRVVKKPTETYGGGMKKINLLLASSMDHGHQVGHYYIIKE